MTKEHVLEKARGFAVIMLEKYGELRPVISVHLKAGGVSTLDYDGSPRTKNLAVATIKLVKKSGFLDFGLLLSEAWMSALDKDEKPAPGMIPASQRANKKEIIIAHVVNGDGTTQTAIWPMTRDANGKPTLGEALALAEKSESWLDEAVR